MAYMNDQERMGYDARRDHNAFHSRHEGGYDYQRGWEMAESEERCQRAREEERREERLREEQEEKRMVEARIFQKQQEDLIAEEEYLNDDGTDVYWQEESEQSP